MNAYCLLPNQSTSGNVCSVTGESGMSANVGVDVGIVSLAHSVEQLFQLPGLVAAILNFGIRPTSGNADRVISTSILTAAILYFRYKSDFYGDTTTTRKWRG